MTKNSAPTTGRKATVYKYFIPTAAITTEDLVTSMRFPTPGAAMVSLNAACGKSRQYKDDHYGVSYVQSGDGVKWQVSRARATNGDPDQAMTSLHILDNFANTEERDDATRRVIDKMLAVKLPPPEVKVQTFIKGRDKITVVQLDPEAATKRTRKSAARVSRNNGGSSTDVFSDGEEDELEDDKQTARVTATIVRTLQALDLIPVKSATEKAKVETPVVERLKIGHRWQDDHKLARTAVKNMVGDSLPGNENAVDSASASGTGQLITGTEDSGRETDYAVLGGATVVTAELELGEPETDVGDDGTELNVPAGKAYVKPHVQRTRAKAKK